MTSQECRYSAEQFVKLCDNKEVAKKYISNNPKENYGSEDFDAVYYLTPSKMGGRHDRVSATAWREQHVMDDRIIDIYAGECE